jgi:hypothetical protein
MIGLSAVSKAVLWFPFLFEVPPEMDNLMRLPVKSPELVIVFIEAGTLKVIFLTIKMQKKIKNHWRLYRKY